MSQLFARIVSLNLALASTTSLAAAPKTYQVTGPILEVTPAKIVVQKGNEKWELLRDPNTKVDGELKVGAKATISYTMSAVTVSAKADKAAPPASTK